MTTTAQPDEILEQLYNKAISRFPIEQFPDHEDGQRAYLLHLATLSPVLQHFSQRFKGGSLQTQVVGRDYKSPLFIDAGFDKHGIALEALDAVAGIPVVGSIPHVQRSGNAKPRFLIDRNSQLTYNAMGFNFDNAPEETVERIKAYKIDHRPYTVAASIAIIPMPSADAPDSDLTLRTALENVKKVEQYCDIIFENSASPNTSLDAFYTPEFQRDFVSEFNKRFPGTEIGVKLRPAITEEQKKIRRQITRAVVDAGARIIIYCNTLPSSVPEFAMKRGGLGGAKLQEISMEGCEEIKREYGNGVSVWRVGGVGFDYKSDYRSLQYADMLGMVSAPLLNGIGVIKELADHIRLRLLEDGYQNLGHLKAERSIVKHLHFHT